jgi:hypothetical protein
MLMPQNTAKRQSPNRGRATPKQGARRGSGRYTEPIPRSVHRSPVWYPWMLLALLLVGLVAIILNYIDLLPASPSNWYTVGGLISIVAGALAATRYH